jgi:hypothetical protein
MKNFFNMNRTLRILIAALASLLAAPAALAQTQTQSQSDNHESEKPADNPWYADSDGAYTVSLGTGQLISLYPHVRNDQQIPSGEYADSGQPVMVRARDYRYQFFYGGSVSSVYTNSVGGISTGGNTDLFSTSVNPYVALFMPTRTGRYLVQYSGVVNPNDTSSGGPQAYHTLTLSAMGSFNERLFWTASSSGSYGSESARLQGPLSFLVISSTPIADTTSTAVLLRAKNVAFVESSLGLGWLKSRRDRVLFSVFHTYTGIEGDSSFVPFEAGSHANAIGSKAEYIRSMTQRIDLRAYGEAETVLNGPKCNTYGTGLGLGFKLSHSVVFDVAGGPQWSSSTCGSPQSASFSASLVKNFGNRDRIYASVNRMFTTVAQLDSHWEDNATVGFSKGLRRFTLTADAGYLRGTPITTIVPAYHGYFIAPRLRYKITNTIGASAGYRSFHGAGGNLVSGNASYAVVGLEWYPAPLHFR